MREVRRRPTLARTRPVPGSWLDRRVIAFAHQGGAREAPSSTIFAIKRALAVGATAIELDVHATKDGRLVVCHDATIERTTSGSGAIHDHTFDELRTFDNAYWYVEGEDAVRDRPAEQYRWRGSFASDPDFGVASLEEVLDLCRGVVLNLDIKQTGPAVVPYEETLARLLAEHGRTADDVIVASFIDGATEAFRRVAAGMSTSAGTQAVAEFYRAVRRGEDPPPSISEHVALQVPATFQQTTVVDEQFVEAAHRHGLAVHVWTIDERDEMERLVALGVDGIISDRPSLLVEVLKEAGVYWTP